MNTRTSSAITLLLFTIVVLFSCKREGDPTGLPPLPENGQAISLLGDTLYTPSVLMEGFDELEDRLEQNTADYHADPGNAAALIWLGRVRADMGEYRESAELFTEGINRHPDDPRMYRHRGHRYITLRMFDRAIEDLEKAEELMAGRPDEPEPDIIENPAGIPASTLKSNVWYHLGLAHYLNGEFDKAAEPFEKALELDLSADMETSVIYWYYMALKRDGKDLEAGQILERISEHTDLLESEVYLNLLLVFKGVFDADYLMESSPLALQNATLAYGIGNWHYMNGREERAFGIWENLHAGSQTQWPAFGYIAAEAELARHASGR